LNTANGYIAGYTADTQGKLLTDAFPVYKGRKQSFDSIIR